MPLASLTAADTAPERALKTAAIQNRVDAYVQALCSFDLTEAEAIGDDLIAAGVDCDAWGNWRAEVIDAPA